MKSKQGFFQSANILMEPFIEKHTEILLKGTIEAEIQGCLGLLTYEDQLISMNIKEGILNFRGEHLSLQIYRDRFLTLTGEIKEISFSKKEGDAACIKK